MTSSLVGSEMCIRDRSNRAPPVFEGIYAEERQGRTHGNKHVEDGHTIPCLLYTSDAADDM
eukprot:6590956-Prorocentrum_lima.AAC.1